MITKRFSFHKKYSFYFPEYKMTSSSIGLSVANSLILEGPGQQCGFYPDLYGVAAGTYTSSSYQDYGVGVPVSTSGSVPVDYAYGGYQMNGDQTTGTNTSEAYSQCTWYSSNNVVSFNLVVSLPGGLGADPFVTGAPYELRIRPNPEPSNAPGLYNITGLPLPDPIQDSPVFPLTAVLAPTTNVSSARTRLLPFGALYGVATVDFAFPRARLLNDGTFALFTNAVDGTGGTSTPDMGTDQALTTAMLYTQALSTNSTNRAVMLQIKGSYLSQ
jgi:hypothetical protein